jgi:hypothetical protein
MEEKSIDNLNKGIDIAVSILKNEFTFVTGWKYKHDPDFFNSTVYIILICDMDKSSEFYNSPIKDYYKNLEADVTYPFSPLEMSTEIDNEEKYELYKEIQKSLDETYYEIPNDYRHTFKSYASDTDLPKEINIDGFVFPAPEKLSESESVNDKVSLAKSLIYQLFDEVSFIEQSVYVSSINGKPSLTVYFDSDDTAANIESVFTHEICDTLRDYTGGEIKCAPSWGPESRRNRNNPDILIDAIQLEYDDEGNVINESKEDNITEVKRNLKVINTLLSLVSWDGLCSIWVDYNPEDEEYEIRSKTTESYFDDNNVEQELNSLEDSISSMGIRVYIYTPWYVENCEDEPEFLNESKEESQKQVIENILNTIVLPEYEDLICGFEIKESHERFDAKGDTPFKFISVTVTFITEYGTKYGIPLSVRDKFDDIMNDIWDVIYNYTNIATDVYHKTVSKCEGKVEFMNEDYSPAGKKIIPNEIVVHKSNPIWRKNILETGLQVSVGECYKTYVGYGEKCIPAIFATNSTNKRAWFDSTYDDDIWFINTKMIPDVKWYKDKHFESTKKHIVTFENIPPEVLTLKYQGSGSDKFLKESENKKSNYVNVIKQLVEPFKNEDCVCDINVSYDEEDDMYSVYVVTSTKELREKFFYVDGIQQYVLKLRVNINKTIVGYLPIENLYVGSYGKPNCEWNPTISEAHKVDKDKFKITWK